MKLMTGLKKRLFAFALMAAVLTANGLPGQMTTNVKAAEEAGDRVEEVTLQSVREEAAASYAGSEKKGFDIDFDTPFAGSGLDYSEDTADRHYIQVLNNLKDGTDDQTVVIRFKTTNPNGLLFGAGTSTTGNGKNMIVALKGGELRIILRSVDGSGVAAPGMKGSFGSGFADGNYHTLAISFLPSMGLQAGNVRMVVDGGSDLYLKSWGETAAVGFNQNTDAYTKFEIAGGMYAYNDSCNSAAFNGEIDFLTLINKAYTEEELQKITQGDKSLQNFSDMWAKSTCKTWLFTGGTEGVADFATSRTTRNWVGLFETDMRESGTYVVRGRFVFNTAKRGADVAQILEEYDTRVSSFGTSAVGIMIGAADYQKGEEGIPEFKENLQAFLNKVTGENKRPLILTPYPALEEADQENVVRYTEAIQEVAGNKFKVIDLSGLESANINEDGSLKPAGHQAIATKLQREVGAPVGRTNAFNQFSDGSYTVAKQTTSGEEAEVRNVIAGIDTITVSIDAEPERAAQLEYTLTANGEVISGAAPEGETEFTITGLKQGETYRLNVYDVSRGSVKESYRPVQITVVNGAVGESIEYEDGNVSVNEKIQNLLSGDTPATWLFMGDSITHGVITDGYDNVPQLFAKYLDEIGRADDIVLNTGVTNATIATTLEQIEPRLRRYHPDVVMIMLGTNDTSVKGENIVHGFENTAQASITVEQYADRYKELIREIYKTNPDASVVLRVPCDMAGQLSEHAGFEDKFAEIKNIAADMREEIQGLNIAVVDHLQGWREYRDTVRNDNITIRGTYSWLANRNNDGIHPNGRGNLAMFQQIIKELGLYVPASELANYQYNLNEWTDTSDIAAPVVQKRSRASFEMRALSGYANGLRNVTLTLTADGRSISKTAEYDAEGIVAVSGLDTDKTYTVTVTGTDAANSKEITFAATLSQETDTTATEEEKEEYTESLKAAKEFDMTSYPSEVREAYEAAIKAVEEKYADGASMTIDQIEEALTAIRLAKVQAQTSFAEALIQAREDLKTALGNAKKTLDAGEPYECKKEDWDAFTVIYGEAERVAADEAASVEELREAFADLIIAENKVLFPPTICPPPPRVEQNCTYTENSYRYLVTSLAKKTVTVTGTTNANLSRIIIGDQVKLADGTYYEITAIGAKAFMNHKNASSVQIGKNVEKIGDQAFAKCAKLKKVVVQSTRLTEIGKKAFLKDKNLKSISIKSKALKSVGKNAFKGTHAKLKITVPKAKYRAYVKKLAKKGQSKSAVIRKK